MVHVSKSPIEDTKINENAPHQAIITVTCNIHEKEISGKVVHFPVESSSKMFTFVGNNFEEAKKQAQDFLDRIY